MKLFAVIRVRGSINMKPDIMDTLKMLKLARVNHCVLIPENAVYSGMIHKAKDYITWGEVDSKTLSDLISKRGLALGQKKVTDEYIKSVSDYPSVAALSEALLSGQAKYKELKDIKPLFRLNPPRSGYKGGTKHPYNMGGSLGYQGENINKLIRRML